MPTAYHEYLVKFYASILTLAVASAQDAEVGSRACAGCHAEIFAKYQATGMARSAGRTGAPGFAESFAQAAFTDPASGADYRIDSNYQLSFSRDGIEGQRLLSWFLGSGKVGRSYLFGADGFLFQAPVSYYSEPQRWDVSPGYQRKRTVELTRGVETACLQCHTSRIQTVAEAQNRFAAVPFLEGGVSCERCHGGGRAHIAKMGTKVRTGGLAIVNPAKLDAARRDSVCAQCHLTGAARVARGSNSRYRPGDLLSDSVAVFVWEGASGGAADATSHYEKLEQSKCKQASGSKLWCATCHDPHSAVPLAKRAEHYRQACLSCHATKPCTGDGGPDCASCHMPNRQTRSVDHLAYTDHSIARRPGSSPTSSTERLLTNFWKAPANDRDLALGYAVVAPTEASVRPRALEQLERAAAHAPNDVPILAQLAQFYDRLGREDDALALCERLLKLDPAQVASAVNLGIYRMKRGRAAEAIQLWEGVLQRQPALTGARMNLAVAHYRAGNRTAAEAALRKALDYEPDLAPARRMLAELQAAK